jgi:hypothetical protein
MVSGLLLGDGPGGDASSWRARTGFDAASGFVPTRPTGVQVFVRPNRYEPGRAHVVVYNWAGKPAVEVPLGAALKPGQRYRVVRAQDFFGKTLVQGTFDGKRVRLPMASAPAVAPVGMADFPLPVTTPEFDVFVVLPD